MYICMPRAPSIIISSPRCRIIARAQGLTFRVGVRPEEVISTALVLCAVVLAVIGKKFELPSACIDEGFTEFLLHGHSIFGTQLTAESLEQMCAVGVARPTYDLSQ